MPTVADKAALPKESKDKPSVGGGDDTGVPETKEKKIDEEGLRAAIKGKDMDPEALHGALEKFFEGREEIILPKKEDIKALLEERDTKGAPILE